MPGQMRGEEEGLEASPEAAETSRGEADVVEVVEGQPTKPTSEARTSNTTTAVERPEAPGVGNGDATKHTKAGCKGEKKSYVEGYPVHIRRTKLSLSISTFIQAKIILFKRKQNYQQCRLHLFVLLFDNQEYKMAAKSSFKKTFCYLYSNISSLRREKLFICFKIQLL